EEKGAKKKDNKNIETYCLQTDYGELSIVLYKDEPGSVSGYLNVTKHYPNWMDYETQGNKHSKGLEALVSKINSSLNTFKSNVTADVKKIGRKFQEDYKRLAKENPSVDGFHMTDEHWVGIGSQCDGDFIVLALSTSVPRVHTRSDYQIGSSVEYMTAEELYLKFENLMDAFTDFYKSDKPAKKK
ncbi:MAG: hypothetical protein PHC66_02225, partial [Candidatus Nanoarchaeia archaeon]|nr:hypothetical protein [Candidatus Nanoarchaeia archaeon]